MTRLARLIAWLERRNARNQARSQHPPLGFDDYVDGLRRVSQMKRDRARKQQDLSRIGNNAVTTKRGTP